MSKDVLVRNAGVSPAEHAASRRIAAEAGVMASAPLPARERGRSLLSRRDASVPPAKIPRRAIGLPLLLQATQDCLYLIDLLLLSQQPTSKRNLAMALRSFDRRFRCGIEELTEGALVRGRFINVRNAQLRFPEKCVDGALEDLTLLGD